MSNMINSEELDKYLDRELSEEEMKVFNAKVASDPEFRDLVETQRLLRAGANLSYKEYLKKNVLKDVVEINADPILIAKKYRRKLILQLTASIAAFIAIGLLSFNFFSISNNTDEKIHAIVNDFKPIELSVAGTPEEVLEAAENAYNNKDFDMAILKFDQYLEIIKRESPQILLYKAKAYRYSGSNEEALAVLGRIPDNSFLNESTLWEKSLVYVQMKNFEQAKKILTPLANSSSGKKNRQANRLLNLIIDKN